MPAVTLPTLGDRVPDLPHAVSVQLPQWEDVIDFSRGDMRVRDLQKGGYPRSFLHKDVQQINEICARAFGNPEQACLLFASFELATACSNYLSGPCAEKSAIEPALVQVQPLEIDIKGQGEAATTTTTTTTTRTTPMTLHAVLFPRTSLKQAMIFWRLTGCGISSRLAEDTLAHMPLARRVEGKPGTPPSWPSSAATMAAEQTIRERIAGLLERAPIGGPRTPAVAASDVFLYPTGMSAIYNLTLALRSWPGTKSVVFGFPYELTLKVQQDFAKDCVFHGFGTLAEMELLEDYLHMLAQQDRTIQAVWCECASNPLLRTVDLARLRRLADRYGFLVIVDDTIGSSANVDVLGVADIAIASLTKSFSGYADVMGGSVTLNPASPFYERLQETISASYKNHLYGRDAVRLEENSRQVLPRVAKMNSNAAQLVELLGPFAQDPTCPLQRVYYPSTCSWSRPNYEARMRPESPAFKPGYGGLFTLEFDTIESSAAFFDALQVHKGPSIGANITLALPYVQVVFANEKEWAAQYGLRETIVRVSVGLEDIETLSKAFIDAIAIFKKD
ncbi:hypothetical protein ARSEF1564_007256 [Beauveria bassiana]